MVFNATFNNISAISWRRKPEYTEKTTNLPQITDWNNNKISYYNKTNLLLYDV
jgi:hypothetical protein